MNFLLRFLVTQFFILSMRILCKLKIISLTPDSYFYYLRIEENVFWFIGVNAGDK
ncbi:hypothetical protein SAMN05444412_1236 [Rhodonellum ikkaensis]|uniref:Uncharacterized protein n=1 Tax=Rhodonellum ikkaensis TaxID=336829 RepID=A0A1H3TY38_9BACT|nr:hypothetical protein SAMN05444412_1236 [Rhodonellum ikkaensis]